MTNTDINAARLAAAVRIFQSLHPRLRVDRVETVDDGAKVYFGTNDDYYYVGSSDIDRALSADPPVSMARVDAAVRYWQLRQGGRFLAAHADGEDVIVIHDDNRRYRVHALDITAQLHAEDRNRNLVERLRAHGLTATAGPDGGVVINAPAIEAHSLVNALDRLEALTLDREDGVS